MTARTTRRSILAAGALALPVLGAAELLSSNREVGEASPAAPIVEIPWQEPYTYPEYWAVVNGILCVVSEEGVDTIYVSSPRAPGVKRYDTNFMESVEAGKAWAEARARAMKPQLRRGGWCRVDDHYSGSKWALVDGERILMVNDEGSYGPAAHVLSGDVGFSRLVETEDLKGEEPYALVKTLALVALKRWDGRAS